MASVVGYREEPNFFRKCLQSYLGSPGSELILVGIDGDHDGDFELVRIAEKVAIAPQWIEWNSGLTSECRYSQLRW